MSFSMYSASIPVFQHMLRNLSHILDKGAANAEARKFDPSVLTTWALPNFFFHVTTAYAILRHNGVDLGKPDYLAGAQR